MPVVSGTRRRYEHVPGCRRGRGGGPRTTGPRTTGLQENGTTRGATKMANCRWRMAKTKPQRTPKQRMASGKNGIGIVRLARNLTSRRKERALNLPKRQHIQVKHVAESLGRRKVVYAICLFRLVYGCGNAWLGRKGDSSQPGQNCLRSRAGSANAHGGQW